MAIIGQKRQLDMKEVLSYPLGPLPMSLANPDGSLRKTNKSSLMITLYKDIPPFESCSENSACVFDGNECCTESRTCSRHIWTTCR